MFCGSTWIMMLRSCKNFVLSFRAQEKSKNEMSRPNVGMCRVHQGEVLDSSVKKELTRCLCTFSNVREDESCSHILFIPSQLALSLRVVLMISFPVLEDRKKTDVTEKKHHSIVQKLIRMRRSMALSRGSTGSVLWTGDDGMILCELLRCATGRGISPALTTGQRQ